MLTVPCSLTGLRAALGNVDGGDAVVKALGDCERLRVPAPAAAAWLRSIDDAADQRPGPDLVWSGPEIPGVPARNTRRVYEELLGAAERSIWASTFAYFDGPRMFE